ncbi:MAG: LuxR C-terminal-related transcriptional regulator, partial [Deinococcota bacterium]
RRYAHYTERPSSQYEYLIYAHALLWTARYKDALTFAEANAEAAKTHEHLGYYVGISVVVICAEANLGRSEHAQELLQQVLEVAQPEAFVMQFLHGGTVLRDLLQHLELSSSQLISYRTTLLAAFDEHLARHAASVTTSKINTSQAEQASLIGNVEASASSQTAAPLEPLSAREQTVLRLLLAGMSNKQIAKELGVSVNTVKTHARNVYSKFGVHGRMELVQRLKHLS